MFHLSELPDATLGVVGYMGFQYSCAAYLQVLFFIELHEPTRNNTARLRKIIRKRASLP